MRGDREQKLKLLETYAQENDRLLGTIKLDKDDYHLLRYYNMMVVNRPAALSLQ